MHCFPMENQHSIHAGGFAAPLLTLRDLEVAGTPATRPRHSPEPPGGRTLMKTGRTWRWRPPGFIFKDSQFI